MASQTGNIVFLPPPHPEGVPGITLLCPGEDLCGGAALCTIAQLGKLLAEGGLQHREKGLYMNAPV